MLGIPVRIGAPSVLGDIPREMLTPENACGVGLLLQAVRENPYSAQPASSHASLMQKISQWMRNLLPG
jgi:cell division ATPase FtsA